MRRIIAAALVIVLASAIVTVRSASERHARDGVRMTLERESAELVAKQQREEQRLAAARAAMRARSESVSRDNDAAASPASRAHSAVAGADEKSRPPLTANPKKPGFVEITQIDPEVQQLMLAHTRATIATTYGLFFERTGMTAEQIERCTENMMIRHAKMTDIAAASRAQGLNQDDVWELYRSAWMEYWAAQKALLGPEGVRQMEDYEKTSYLRELVRGVAGAATLEGIPFNSDQAEQLTRLLAKLGNADKAGGSEAGKIDWREFDEEARAFLTPDQLRLLQTVEPNGPRGAGWRFMVQMNHIIGEAKKADRALQRPAR